MGRFLDPQGNATSDESKAAKDPKTGQPVANEARNLWVTETALTTALNMAFLGERVGVFGIVMGIALLLTGIGFLVLTLSGALERKPAAAVAPAARDSHELSGDSARKQRAASGPPFALAKPPGAEPRRNRLGSCRVGSNESPQSHGGRLPE